MTNYTAPRRIAAPVRPATIAASWAPVITHLDDMRPTATVADIAAAYTTTARPAGTTATGWARMSHAACDHDNTPTARRACRKDHGHA
ncbi:hypothetical protein [Arsenicicoccus bolidensis]|uniref:hypothetical protein n=1 Tax=Arsenicicoccus bolidensis TaxID=229480 RepID=UPI00041538E5|nr:hypothetical protein [Arsenicicoccus bolidensis]